MKLSKDNIDREVDEAMRNLCLSLAELVREIKNGHPSAPEDSNSIPYIRRSSPKIANSTTHRKVKTRLRNE